MIAMLIRLVSGVQARWIGIEPLNADGSIPQRIYFANHQSHLDAPVIWSSLPKIMRARTHPVAARDYWEKNSLRRYLSRRVFRAILIERHKVTAHSNPLAALERALEDGDSLIIFPEGTRSLDDDGAVGEFKPGIWHLARKHPEAALVPVHLENLNRILPRGDFILIPLLAAVTFGPPMKIEPHEDKRAFLTRAKAAVMALAAATEAKP